MKNNKEMLKQSDCESYKRKNAIKNTKLKVEISKKTRLS